MELCTSACGNYRIEVLQSKTFPGAMKVMRESYVKDEYVNRAHDLANQPEAIEAFLGFCAESILDSISVVAVEVKTGEVAAVCINKFNFPCQTNLNEETFEEAQKYPCIVSMLEFLTTIEEKCNLPKLYEADCSFELLFLATLKEHRKRNLGYLCCKASVGLAKKLKDGPVAKITVEDLGPDYAPLQNRDIPNIPPQMCQMLCTSVATQRIGKSLGFTVELDLSFNDYTYEGKTFVERVGFDPHCELHGLRLI